ncbi:alpha-1,2-fucosyltransferase [Polycladidibacter stylochi]|uniref:alpha-1,2-fucosyltransferase n=1 Tax=Polycladidibacter stylochi TaxID=1807766 RepID=UPI000834A08E|nr:alpha-1,2-fucosyltransferase [Pseudovibrio stylochi]
MIVMRMRGGLGNQLFQYALGRKISLLNECPLKLDISRFDEGYDRKFLLKHFDIKAEVACEEDLARVLWPAKKFGKSVRRLRRFWPAYRIHVNAEKLWKQDIEDFYIEAPGYADGFFQQYCHASSIRPILLSELKLLGPIQPEREKLAQMAAAQNSVALHIRRGDYLDKDVSKAFGNCTLDYYFRAMEHMQQQLEDPRFMVFSDDTDWAQHHLGERLDVHIVQLLEDERDYEDLVLMSLCKHHIIANSSFSWWAAFLNQYTKQEVVAPSIWFQDGSMEEDKLLLPHWVRLYPYNLPDEVTVMAE